MDERNETGGESESRRRKGMFDYERREDGSFEFVVRPPQISAEFREHISAAQKEFLLAFRSLLDGLIDDTERAERRASRPRDIQVT